MLKLLLLCRAIWKAIPIRKEAMMCTLVHEDEQGVLTRRNQGDSEQPEQRMVRPDGRRRDGRNESPLPCDGSHGAPRRQFRQSTDVRGNSGPVDDLWRTVAHDELPASRETEQALKDLTP